MDARIYEEAWSDPRYRVYSPGEGHAARFVEIARPQGCVVDFGCGTGRGGAYIHLRTGVPILALDFAQNALDPGVRRLSGVEFRRHDLREPLGEFHPFGYCTDVMEHIEPGAVEGVLRNILLAARRVFFAISTVPDHFGPAFFGEPLHLTVRPHEWWLETFRALGARVDFEENLGDASLFYASLYANGQDYADRSGLNASDERIKHNILENLRLELQEVCPHEPQDTPICLLAGGPTLADHESEIISLAREGIPMVSVNGTYRWLMDRGVLPGAHFMVDAREFNDRFVHEIVPTCRYVFSSTAAHETVKRTPAALTWLYHSGDNELVRECFDTFCRERGVRREWYPVYGGSTVTTRALVALAMLGFRNIEVFGWDSCLREGAHHAYAQPENDDQQIVEIEVGGRRFFCHPWMVIQAHEVPKIIRYILGPIEGFQLNVRGDGLIAHILEHAAAMAEKEH